MWKTQPKYEDTDRLKVESCGTRKKMAQWLIVHTKVGFPFSISSSLQQTVMPVPGILTPLLSLQTLHMAFLYTIAHSYV